MACQARGRKVRIIHHQVGQYQFVQLEVWDMQSAKEAIVQRLSVQTCASEPGSDGGLSKAKDTLSSRRIQPFGERSQHHCDLMGRGFQTVQGGVASSTERGAAGLAAKGLDPLSMAMLAITDQSVNVGICDPGVRAYAVRTGETFCVHPLRGTSAAFHLTPGAYWRRGRTHT